MLVVSSKARPQPLLSCRCTASAEPILRRILHLTYLGLLLFLFGGPLQAQTHRPAGENRARSVREEAKRAIPYEQLPATVQNRIWEVVENPSIYRRMLAEPIHCDPDLFKFMVRNPEVIVNIWQLMGITNVALDRVDEATYTGSDGAGTECVIRLLHSDNHLHLLYAKGFYQGKLLKNKVRGDCVLILRTAYEQDGQNRPVIKNHLDVFLRLNNAGVSLLAKTLHPLFGKTADHNFVESTKFLGRISVAAETNAAGVQRLADRLTSIEPGTQVKFSELTAAVSHRAIMLDSAAGSPRVKLKVGRKVKPSGNDRQVFGRPIHQAASRLPPPRHTLTLRR